MKIFAVKKPSYAKPVATPAFRAQKSIKPSDNRDGFDYGSSNIFNYETGPDALAVKRVTFKSPVHVSKALESIVNSHDEGLENAFIHAFHTMDELASFSTDLKKAKELSKHKVRTLHSTGIFALAFETEDGKILKITGNEHFPKNRKPDFFDLPILKQGKHGYTHYYLEEKVSQKDITQEELREFVKKIKAKGYYMRDYLMHFDDVKENTIKLSQFGRAKNGKIYLIDPGCAVAPPKHFFDPKTIKDKIKDIFLKR